MLIKDDDTGLGIKKSLYSGKHKGEDDKLAAGMDIKTISMMTERYLHSLRLKRLQEARKIQMKTF
ncbi:hypothetical protein ACL0VS_17945 [Chryseobacterium sp. PMSZPI]|uniref:hypothetical protein n=1 Tax=Chryseobacterium sp. PMSZPI TaxID=1033900 RepID=UPI00399FD2E9